MAAEAGVETPTASSSRVTAAPDKAVEFGIDETRVLPFARRRRRALFAVVVGRLLGRAGARLGRVRGIARRRGRDGSHMSACPGRRQYPAARGLRRPHLRQRCRRQTRAVFAYDERLRLLPSYLQQLEMESNGKSVTPTASRSTGPSRADHVGRDRDRCPARRVPAASPGHAPGAGRIRRGQSRMRTASTRATTACCCSMPSRRARR